MNRRDDDEEDDDAIGADDVMMIVEGILHEGDAILPVCGSTYCENGGTCIKNEINDYLCACPELFFGARCERSTILYYISSTYTILTAPILYKQYLYYINST